MVERGLVCLFSRSSKCFDRRFPGLHQSVRSSVSIHGGRRSRLDVYFLEVARFGAPSQVSIVVSQVRAYLSQELTVTFRNMQGMRRDSRIQPIVTSLSKQYNVASFNSHAMVGKITADQIPVVRTCVRLQ
jgi:hypothetical protein